MKPTLLLAALLCAPQAFAATDYQINFPTETTVSTEKRSLNAISLGEESATVGQQTDGLLYHDLTASAIFAVTAGEEVKPAVDWTGTWMHAYVYVDLNGDGQFDPQGELISYTYLDGKNSIGVAPAQDVSVATLPPFVVPALAAGDYRMRFKIDWNSNDPGGRNTTDNNITANSGAIVDATLRVTAPVAPAEETYKVNYQADAKITHAGRRLSAVSVTSPLLGTQRVEVTQVSDLKLYFDCTETEVIAPKGMPLTLGFDWAGDWMNAYFYIDRAGNGDFAVNLSDNGTPLPGSDLIAFSNLNAKNSLGNSTGNGNTMAVPSFYVPAELAPGRYRARAKIDWDNVDPAGATEDKILTNGGAIVDFTLNVPETTPEAARITPMAMNGLILGADGQPLAETFGQGFDLKVKALPTLEGFATDKLIVRHGPADALVDSEVELGADGMATIAGELIDSDITIYALFTEQADSRWTKVWGDEFNSESLNPKKWSYHPRYNATWNRLVAQGRKQQELVNTVENGAYNSWCIPTPEEFTDEEQPMISGAIYTQGKFDFTYGKIEARIKTTPHLGNFPAFWLMPSTNADGGWPLSGEIDIWEQVDATNAAHSTVHSGWTGWKEYCKWPDAPKKASPTSTNNVYTDAAAWHVYALEWDAEEIKWFVDGVQTFSYRNQHYSEEGTNYTENICWPFYKNFYIILNQSVGNGSWAKPADTSFTYQTLFDYVRVYKQKGDDAFEAIASDNGDDPNFYVPLSGGQEPVDPVDPVEPEDPDQSGIDRVEAGATASPVYFDLRGRRVACPKAPGVYLEVSGSRVTKIIR